MRKSTQHGKPEKGHSSREVMYPNAAGIDVGSMESYVAVPEDRDEQPVRKFGCFTEDLHALANWLRQCGVDTVAMESTGVYWVPLFQILVTHGFDVFLVNARHVKNVTVSGYNNYTPSACCPPLFDQRTRSVSCAPIGATGTI